MAQGMDEGYNSLDNSLSEPEVSSWKELPSAVLCQILTLIPYKRVDVKAVCSNWRQAINSSIDSVNIPEADLSLLSELPNIKHLTVHGGPVGKLHYGQHSSEAEVSGITTRCPIAAWPPSTAQQPTANSSSRDDDSSCGGIDHDQQHHYDQETDQQQELPPHVDSFADPRLLRQLVTLRLVHCPQAVLQLANSLCEPDAEDITRSPQPAALASVKVLELSDAGCLTKLLMVLLGPQQQQQQQQHKGPGPELQPLVKHSNSDSCNSPGGVALQRLEELAITSCDVSEAVSGQLQLLLQQLPALHVLQLSDCDLPALAPGIFDCTQLTRLVLSNNHFITHLPHQISQLVALQELNLEGCGRLRSLGPGFSSLTSLTALNLSGPSGLWLDYSVAQDISTASAVAPNQVTAASSNSRSTRMVLRLLLLPPLPHQQQRQLLPELANLSRLHTLNLSNNRKLMVVPGCVSMLHGLSVLDLCGCGVRWLGEDVLDCGGLQELWLGDNVLAELPEDISRLANLKMLDLGACCSLWSLPRSLLHISTLEYLRVPSKSIGQHILEQLELRGSNPVDVRVDPAASEDYEEYDEGGEFEEALSSGSSSD